MAAYEVLLLNTAVPQIQAAQSGDTYVVPRDIAFSAALTLSAGTPNGVPYLSSPGKVLTTGSALTFDGTNFANTLSANSSAGFRVTNSNAGTSTSANTSYSNGAESHEFGILGTNYGGYGVLAARDAYIYAANTRNIAFASDGGLIKFGVGTGAAELMRLTSTGLGIGTSSPGAKLEVSGGTSAATFRLSTTNNQGGGAAPYNFGELQYWSSDAETAQVLAYVNAVADTSSTLPGSILAFGTSAPGTGTAKVAERMRLDSDGTFRVKGAGTAGTTDAFQVAGTAPADAARITSGGNLLVGTNDNILASNRKLQVEGAAGATLVATGTTGEPCAELWQKATSGDNTFLDFFTETSSTARGSITYNRTAGLVAYNTTSDYRAKDILGPVANSGATIDALKVYEGKMKGATQSRPMLVAHEAQEHAPYAVTGEKDAVNEDGTPKYQQMDVSALVPLLLAEIQSLRARVAQLEQGA